jgi:hypothetical protein
MCSWNPKLNNKIDMDTALILPKRRIAGYRRGTSEKKNRQISLGLQHAKTGNNVR